MKRRHSFGPMSGGEPCAPYASSAGIVSSRRPPLRMPGIPWSQPAITLPSPSLNVKGLPRSHDASNSTLVLHVSPTYCIETVSPFFATGPLPTTMSRVCSVSGGSSSGTVTTGFFVRSVLDGVGVAFGVAVAFAAVSPSSPPQPASASASTTSRRSVRCVTAAAGLRLAPYDRPYEPPSGSGADSAQPARLDPAARAVHGAVPRALRRSLHGRQGPARGEVDLPNATRRDPRYVLRARRRPAPGRGLSRARAGSRLAVRAAARRRRAPRPAQADAARLPRRANARPHRRDGGGRRGGGRRLASWRAVHVARAHAGADARGDPA